MENWKSIKGYEGIYSISDFGRVRRDCDARGVLKGSFLNKKNNSNNYPTITLRKNMSVKMRTIHSLVLEHFLGSRPKGFVVNHKDGVKNNNRVSNLEYVTQKQNIDHGWDIGLTKACGEKHYKAKLTYENVDLMRKEYIEGGVSQYDLARKYGLKQSTVCGIINNKSWKRRLK